MVTGEEFFHSRSISFLGTFFTAIASKVLSFLSIQSLLVNSTTASEFQCC
jgi:ABC-type phosphate/phosphonate transport system permease subunit